VVIAFAVFLALHGLIHVAGFAKAFGYAELPAIRQPISHAMGIVWLAGGVLFMAAGISLLVWPRGWWALGAAAVVLSLAATIAAGADARLGLLANTVAVAGIAIGLMAHGPFSQRAAYEHDVASVVRHDTGTPPRISDADLAHLPALVQRYLRTVGVVGQPRVRNVHVTMHGRIRSAVDAPWMPFTAEQVNTIEPRARLFYMRSTRMGLPFYVYHRYAGAAATMRVKVLGAVTVVDESGETMTQAETVTLLNDLCVFAPAALIDPTIGWEDVDTSSVRATFTNAGHTIRARLVFAASGELIDFWSDDRRQTSGESGVMRPARWRTPLGEYRRFAGARLASAGEGRWHDASGDWAYIELSIDDVRYN
jgi:hypothetical protein